MSIGSLEVKYVNQVTEATWGQVCQSCHLRSSMSIMPLDLKPILKKLKWRNLIGCCLPYTLIYDYSNMTTKIFCDISQEHVFKLAALLVGTEKPIYSSQDLFIKLVEIDPFVDTKRYPPNWKEDLAWKCGATVLTGDGVRLHKVREWSNRKLIKVGRNRYTLSDDDRAKAVKTLNKIERLTFELPKVIYRIVDGMRIPTSREDSIVKMMSP